MISRFDRAVVVEFDAFALEYKPLGVEKPTFDRTGKNLLVVTFVPGDEDNIRRIKWFHLLSGRHVKEFTVVGRVLDIHSSGALALVDPGADQDTPMRRITLVNLEDGTQKEVLLKSTTRIRMAKFSPDGKSIAVLFRRSEDPIPDPPPAIPDERVRKPEYVDVRIVDCQSGATRTVDKVPNADSLFFNASGDRLLTSRVGSMIWKFPSGEKALREPTLTVRALLANGRVAIGTPYEEWKFFDVETRREIAKLAIAPVRGRVWPIRHTFVTPDERYLIGAGPEGRIAVWEIPKKVREYAP